MSNLSENRLDLVLTPADYLTMSDAIRTFVDLLPGHTSLTDEQRLSYSAINVVNKVFCEDVLSESQVIGTDILPAYINLSALENDLVIFKQLDDLSNALDNAQQRLSDAKRIAGHEAFSQSTVIYNAIKMASDVGIPNAKAAYTKLKVRFEVSGNPAGRAPETEV